MSKSTIQAAGWVLVGMVLMGLIVWFTMPSLMLVKHKSNLNYDETVAALSETLKKKQDWRVLTVNDYQKSAADFGALERVGSVTICNPRYASKILANDEDRGVTAFMPLGLGVYEDKKGQVFVSQLNVGLLGMLFGGTIADVMGMAGKDLNEVVASISVK
ncbi:MAG: DUF302 domain-containing protein [Gammaproteobacteria bacterium]|nr:DUF302 domain-containing protein [Gammaproteobacteria bacterium]MBU1980284.1 DUF302 domain-containing protein [Gammaproteobacteria bacterium]